MNFFVVPPATSRVLHALVILCHERRSIVRANAIEHPPAEWVAQQVVDAFPRDEAPRFWMRERDSIHGSVFSR